MLRSKIQQTHIQRHNHECAEIQYRGVKKKRYSFIIIGVTGLSASEIFACHYYLLSRLRINTTIGCVVNDTAY